MKPRCRNRGFTLIECMVTIMILGIGVIGVASMFTYASVSQRKAQYMVQAREIADRVLEQVRTNADASCAGASGSCTISTPGLPHSTGILAWQPYPGTPSDGSLKLVAVNITWTWPKPAAGKYFVATLVSSEGGI